MQPSDFKLSTLINRLVRIDQEYINKTGKEPFIWEISSLIGVIYDITLCDAVEYVGDDQWTVSLDKTDNLITYYLEDYKLEQPKGNKK